MKKLITAIILASLILTNFAACSPEDATVIEQSGGESSDSAGSEISSATESSSSDGTTIATTQGAVGRDDAPSTTTRGNQSSGKNDPPPVEAVPMGGKTSDPDAALSPKITTTGEGDEPRNVSTGALAGVGEKVTLDGVTTTIEKLDIPFDSTVEVTPSKPLLDGIDCTVNEIAADGIVSESLKIFSVSSDLLTVGLDPAMYSDSFFENYCLGVVDIPISGTVASSKIISLVEKGENNIELGIRFERSAKSGLSSKRYLIELPKKYIGYTMSLRRHYSDAIPTSTDWVYTKTAFSYTLDYPSLGSSFTNRYEIPALSFDTTAARSLNEDIERTVYKACGDLIFGYENGAPGVTSAVTYSYGKSSGNTAIWIMLAINNSGKHALNASQVYAFYYDINTARRLTTAEYLAMNGLSREQIATDLANGYSVTLDAASIEAVRVYGAGSYVLSYWDGGALHEYVLPVTIASNGTKYIYNTTSDGYYGGITVAMPDGRNYNIGGFLSVTPPTLKFDESGTLLVVGFNNKGTGDTFMVVGLENGTTLYSCIPNVSEIAGWYGLPNSPISLVPRSISGTSSQFGVVIDVTVGATGAASGLMYYDSLSGKLTHLNADGLSVAGPFVATPSGAALSITNGTVTYTVPGAFNKPYTVEYSSDFHYAVVSSEIGTFTIDEAREGQSTLSTKYADYAITIVDLESGKFSALPEYSIADLLAAVNLRDPGYVHKSMLFGNWTSHSTFTAVVTLMNEDGSEMLNLTVNCQIVAGAVSVVSIVK